ncbi:hypothetical protein A6V39_02725 [Candidatus Mycoplasma haematobovis]|uniref:Uncharacterized protein n=1 Tax=Candidatus Mycoplasma haematobovis TaxID=432608 RepID=A0A1A9QDK1_9MOLU|nr:hypothetical protein [Candidatus Mycoplasma haematobovis]OAL10328.1 hypothetical protein A6V39_02725 [Candidatus Mycoplasma haematobovis]
MRKDNYKDFAVIQVKFKNQNYTEKATGNFCGKYLESFRKPLGIFPWERELPKKEEHLKNNKYSLGYEVRVSATKYDNRNEKLLNGIE